MFSNDQSSLIQAQCQKTRVLQIPLSHGSITTKIRHICNGSLQYAQGHFVRSLTLESSYTDHDNSLTVSPCDIDTSVLSNDSDNDTPVVESSFNSNSSVHIDPIPPEKSPAITFENVISFLSSFSSWNALDKSAQDSLSTISHIIGT